MTYIVLCSNCKGNPDKLIDDDKVSYLAKTIWICPHLKVYESYSKTFWKNKKERAS